MPNISDLKKAIRDGNTELVIELAKELNNNDIDIYPALKLAKDLNKLGKTRDTLDDIVEILESYCDDE